MRTVLAFLFAASVAAQSNSGPVRAVTDPGVVTTRQTITPAGTPAIFNARVYGVAFTNQPDQLAVVTASHVYTLDWRANHVVASAALGGAPGIQSILFDPVRSRPLFPSARDRKTVRLATMAGGKMEILEPELGTINAGGISIAAKPDGQGRRLAAVALIHDNAIALMDADSGKRLATIQTGIAPFTALLSADGGTVWVSNWGGRVPKDGELSAALGRNPNADRVVVDARGVASLGTLVRIDTATQAITHTIPVDAHPNSLAWDQARQRLYVASSNNDSLTVIDTRANRIVAKYPIQPFRDRVTGIAPTALALTANGDRLYVACGGINAVAVVNPLTGRIDGLIPTAWYPSSLSLAPDGSRLAIGALLGAGSGWRDEPRQRFVHSYRGSVHVVDIPDAAQLANYTLAAADNTHMTLPGTPAAQPAARATKATAIPARAGDPSLIEHVVFVVKENRTYDQLFGDLKKGNGDPSLVMFGRDVTPNQHRLAEEFVVLDNFYATGGNSADGHQWLTQANQNAYAMWPGFHGRSYPFDGSDALAIAAGGFLWDPAFKLGKSVRIFGEYAGVTAEPSSRRREFLERWQKGEDFANTWNVTSPVAAMNKILAKQFPAYSTSIPDVIRARLFLAELKQWEAAGKMPHLTIVQLPSDHTSGTLPNGSTPKAMVADNDLALGQIVEGLSRSPFWKKMAIFVVEDDAQNGVDHVDGHRTIALAISPYVRRGAVDSTFYSHQSMLKTMELILGLPTLSLFDLIANDMRASFTDTPDLAPFTAITPSQSLFERNPARNALNGPARDAAIASGKMKWHLPDAAPTEKVNRILWGAIRGWNTPYPGVKQAVFAPLSLEIEDDER